MEAHWPPSGRGGGITQQQGCLGGKAVVTSNVFLDSSALAERYVEEPGSERVEEILSSASPLGVSVISLPQVVSALCRRCCEGKLSRQQYSKARQALSEDIADASAVNVTERVISRAVDLLDRWSLHSSDSLQGGLRNRVAGGIVRFRR